MPKYDWNEWEELEEDTFREKIQRKVKPKKKRKSYNDVKQRENNQISKKHPNRR
jgi:hypothetical protein|tara:strand:+ start:353 stop:514 length:162 start_codon:yes stop_codon:yes gene_type:complete